MLKNKAIQRITYKEIRSTGDPEAIRLFNALKGRHKKFVCHYLLERSAARAYRKAYDNPSMKSESASACGCRLLKQQHVKAFLDEFLDRRVEAYHKVVGTYMDMMDATNPRWLQDKEGQWENVGDDPDWRSRKSGAEGISKLYGFNEEKPLGGEGGSVSPASGVPMQFVEHLNIYLESKGEEKVRIKPDADDAEFSETSEEKSGTEEQGKTVSRFAEDFRKFAGKS